MELLVFLVFTLKPTAEGHVWNCRNSFRNSIQAQFSHVQMLELSGINSHCPVKHWPSPASAAEKEKQCHKNTKQYLVGPASVRTCLQTCTFLNLLIWHLHLYLVLSAQLCRGDGGSNSLKTKVQTDLYYSTDSPHFCFTLWNKYVTSQSLHRSHWLKHVGYILIESEVIRTLSLCLCRGFPVEKCIMLKHLSKEPEEILGSQSPPAKRSCPDLQVNDKLETWLWQARGWFAIILSCNPFMVYPIKFICIIPKIILPFM